MISNKIIPLNVDRAGPGVPLVLAFGEVEPPDGVFGPRELLGQLAGHHQPPFGRIILQDRGRAGFYRGIDGLGGSIEEAVAALRPMIAELDPSEVITFGQGLGGHAALVYGILLGARRIVAVEPPAHLIADELALYNDRRWGRTLDELPDPALARRYDVSALIDRSDFQGDIVVLFGTKRENTHPDAVSLDVVHAHRIGSSDRVTLVPFPDASHELLGRLADRGDLEAVLSRALFDDASTLASPRSIPPLDTERLAEGLLRHYAVHINRHEAGMGESAVAYAAPGIELAETPVLKIDDEWRRWISENLMLGSSPTDLEDTMVAAGISKDEASLELNRAIQSPYFWGMQRLQNRLKKRDWLLATYRKLQRLRPESVEVEWRHRPSRDEFLNDYYTTGRPVIITGVADGWPALERWSLDALASRFGDRTVAIGPAFDGESPTTPDRMLTMTLAEYLTSWPDAGGVLVAGDRSSNPNQLIELWDDVEPIAEYLDGRSPRAGTFRLAPPEAVVPLHHDLVNVLVAQVVGRTLLKLAPSWELPLMENTGRVSSSLDGRTIPSDPVVPLGRPQILECLLEPGELLFLPVGCWSFAETFEPSATLSFTNFAFDNNFGDFRISERGV